MRILPGGAQKGKVSLRARHVVIGRPSPITFLIFFSNVEALAHCAKQRDDTELDLWMSEIKLRAVAQIAKLSRELEKAEFAHDEKGRLHRSDTSVRTATKEQQLRDVGLEVRAVNRYEQLAAPVTLSGCDIPCGWDVGETLINEFYDQLASLTKDGAAFFVELVVRAFCQVSSCLGRSERELGQDGFLHWRQV